MVACTKGASAFLTTLKTLVEIESGSADIETDEEYQRACHGALAALAGSP